MKKRILSGWTFTRALYVVLGAALIINSVTSHTWFGVLLGGYFASMGIFAFSCAAGNCVGGNYIVEPKQNSNAEIEDVDFEEVKQK